MKVILDKLIWIGVGAQIAFVSMMLVMSDVLSSETETVSRGSLAAERASFFSIQMGSLIAVLVVLVADKFIDWRARS